MYQKATLILGAKKIMAYIYLNPAIVAILMFLFEGQTIYYGVLIGILLCSVSSYAQASMEIQMVQISDSGAYNLAEKMNAIAQQYHTEHHIGNLQHAGSMPNSPYDMYIASTV